MVSNAVLSLWLVSRHTNADGWMQLSDLVMLSCVLC